MDSFTPFSALAGGALIGLAASLLMLSLGRVAGISGMFAGALDREPSGSEDGSHRLWFLGGLLLAGVLARLVSASAGGADSGGGRFLLAAAAGLCVGAGTQLGSGCTSGHGVCGLSRFSKRSLVATLTFMGTGILTVAALRAFGALS